MTNDVGPVLAPVIRAASLPTSRFERHLAIIVGVFALAYTLQCSDGLVADLPSMAGPAGVAVVGLVAASVVVGLLPIVLPRHATPLFRVAPALAAIASVVWAATLQGDVPASPMPWFVGMLPAQVAYVIAVRTRTPITLALVTLDALFVNTVLVTRGGLDIEDAVANIFYMLATAAILAMIVRAIRRGIAKTEAAQRAVLDEYGRTRLDEAVEAERVRTDALVHDIVLTTFMAAGGAGSDEEEALARRMAANALRVLGHVNRSTDLGPAAPLRRALVDAAAELQPLLPHFAVRSGVAEDIMLPITVADALVGAMVHSMDYSVRHAGVVARRTLTMSALGPDGVRIVVDDDGAGFDPALVAALPDVRLDVIERLRRVDGRADLRTAPGAGTTVTLSWGSIVISGTTPLAEPSEVLA